MTRIDNQQTTSKNRVEAYTLNMQQQKGFFDCGLFAIACAYELCNGNNPAKINFKQSDMRKHFQSCLDAKKLSAFPQESRDEVITYTLHKFKRS